uniref:CutA divalent cation tolerance homolog n=1 Tax=Leptobrachium leishanense TaxID=445787 RepID=A0A8C5QKS8_9ANUR
MIGHTADGAGGRHLCWGNLIIWKREKKNRVCKVKRHSLSDGLHSSPESHCPGTAKARYANKIDPHDAVRALSEIIYTQSMHLASGSLQRWAILIALCAAALCMVPFLLRLAGHRGLSMASDYAAGSFSAAYVTCPNDKVAKDIARGLVEKKLAACVNIIPQITSIYEWKGKIEEDSEVLLMIKTRTSKVPALSEFVRSVHPYEVCEVISLPIEQGNPPYLQWLTDTVPDCLYN